MTPFQNSPQRATKAEAETVSTTYPFPVPVLPLSKEVALAPSPEWLETELPYVRNFLALAEVALQHQEDSNRLHLLQPGSVRPLLPKKGEFSHPETMSNGRAFENCITLNPWRVWDVFGSAITCMHELTHRANQDFTFERDPFEVAQREVRAHRKSVIDAQSLLMIVGRIHAPFEAVREIWNGSIEVRVASHTIQASAYEILESVQFVLKERLSTARPDARARVERELTKGTLTEAFQVLRSLWRGPGTRVFPAIEALLANSDISAFLTREERERWLALGAAHEQAENRLNERTVSVAESLARFGPSKVVMPRGIGNYFSEL